MRLAFLIARVALLPRIRTSNGWEPSAWVLKGSGCLASRCKQLFDIRPHSVRWVSACRRHQAAGADRPPQSAYNCARTWLASSARVTCRVSAIPPHPSGGRCLSALAAVSGPLSCSDVGMTEYPCSAWARHSTIFPPIHRPVVDATAPPARHTITGTLARGTKKAREPMCVAHPPDRPALWLLPGQFAPFTAHDMTA